MRLAHAWREKAKATVDVKKKAEFGKHAERFEAKAQAHITRHGKAESKEFHLEEAAKHNKAHLELEKKARMTNNIRERDQLLGKALREKAWGATRTQMAAQHS